MAHPNVTLHMTPEYKEVERRFIGRFRAAKGQLMDRGDETIEHMARDIGDGLGIKWGLLLEIVHQLFDRYERSGKIQRSKGCLQMKTEVMNMTPERNPKKISPVKRRSRQVRKGRYSTSRPQPLLARG